MQTHHQRQTFHHVIPSFLSDTQCLQLHQMIESNHKTPFVTPLVSRNNIKLLPQDHSLVKSMLEAACQQFGLQMYNDCLSFRQYGVGDYMDWHVDYEGSYNGQYEVYEGIVTIVNTSDSRTEFETDGEIVSYQSVPGDLLMVCRDGVRHRVTNVTQGERITVKCSLVTKSSGRSPTCGAFA
jgi:hypothetical protein